MKKIFKFLLNIFALDFGEYVKQFSSIAKWGRWTETVDVKLPDIIFELQLTLQKILSIKVGEELEILVGSSTRGDRKLDESVSTKLLTGSNVLNCSTSMLKSPRRKILFEFFLLSFSNNGSKISQIIHLEVVL